MKFLSIVLLFISCILCASDSNAQFNKNNALYFDVGFATNKFRGISGHLNYVRNYKFGCYVGVMYIDRSSPTTPSDFNGGYATWFSPVEDYIAAKTIGFGYMIALNDKNSVRFYPKIGLSYFQTRKTFNWEKVDPQWIFDSNYTFEYKLDQHFGMTLNLPMEMAFSRFLGLVIDPHFLFMKKDFHISFEIGLMLGIMREKKMNLDQLK